MDLDNDKKEEQKLYEEFNNSNNTVNMSSLENEVSAEYNEFSETQELKDEIKKLKKENQELEHELEGEGKFINTLNIPNKNDANYIDADHVSKLYEKEIDEEKIKRIKEIKKERHTINNEKKLLYVVTLIAVVWIGISIYNTYMTKHSVHMSLNTISLVKTRNNFGTYDIKYLITPDNVSKTPKLKSNNENVLINETTGSIKANQIGEAEISVYSIDDDKKVVDKIKVFVVEKEVHIEDYETDSTEYNLKVGEKKIIKLTAKPENTTDILYQFSSNKPNIAAVTNGIIEGKQVGSTIIKISNNKIIKTITVNVTN